MTTTETRHTTAEIVDQDLTPTIVVTSAGGTLLSELLKAAREAWTIPGPLELVSTTDLPGDRYRTVFAPLLTEPCS